MIFSKKKTLFLTMMLVLMVSLAACGGSSDNDQPPAGDGGGSEVVGLEEAFAEQPVLLTSVGQSADVEMVKSLMDNAGIEHTMDKVVTADGLGDTKTLILAVGGSSKGLGAAGIDAADELARTNELIAGAKAKDVKVIAMHIGGEPRRGDLSDGFIEPACKDADYIIIVESGNPDGLFTKIASQNSIPMEGVTSIADVVEPLKKAFK